MDLRGTGGTPMKAGIAIALLLSLTLLAPLARAQDAKLAEAKTYFNAGSEAFDAGQFLAAAQAFEQANRLLPKPAIVFSIAQSYRRQYYIDRKPEHARQAQQNYRQYLQQVPKGGRRSDAARALAELEPAGVPPSSGTSTSALPVAALTRVMISAPNTEGAVIALDGGDPVPSPLIEEVRPGKHRATITAPGYVAEQRELLAVEGALVAVEAPLREKPALLLLSGPAGAQVSIDGRVVATLPLTAPLQVPPGRRWIAVSQTGRVPFSRLVELERGTPRPLQAVLETSSQRYVAHAGFIAGATGLVAGGALGALALSTQAEAREIESAGARHNISLAEADAHDRAIERRDAFRTAAIISASAGAAIGLTGLALYIWDRPTAVAPAGAEDPDRATPRVPARTQLELSLCPSLAPGTYGLSLNGAL